MLRLNHLQTFLNYRPYPKDGEGNVFSVCPHLGGGGGVRSSWGVVRSSRGGSGPAGGCQVQLVGGGQVQPGGVRSSQGGQVQPGGVRSSQGGSGPARGGSGSARGGGVRSSQQGGVSILCPLAGGMPLAFTQEDFLF